VPRLPRVNARETLGALAKAGFFVDHQHGGHVVMVHIKTHRTAVVPEHGGQDLALGTLHRVLDQAGVTVEEFIELLK
jgi:predicted RNA binding protein YcfA (HicA-like mRNA interferase family)